MHRSAHLFQMTIYVFFPVALFYYFNRPEFQRKALEEKKVVNHQPSNYQCMHMQFIISLTVESALSRRKCKPVFKLMYAACIELLSCMMQLPPLSIDEVRALRLKLRQERKQQQQQLEEQQQREAMATHDQQSTTTQYRT